MNVVLVFVIGGPDFCLLIRAASGPQSGASRPCECSGFDDTAETEQPKVWSYRTAVPHTEYEPFHTAQDDWELIGSITVTWVQMIRGVAARGF
jgi:hypothetical protein